MQPAYPTASLPQVAFYAPDGQLLQVLDGAAGSGREATAIAGACGGEAVVVGAYGCLRAYALGDSDMWEAGPPCPVRCLPQRNQVIAGSQLGGRSTLLHLQHALISLVTLRLSKVMNVHSTASFSQARPMPLGGPCGCWESFAAGVAPAWCAYSDRWKPVARWRPCTA